jgi:hypothetical protein
MLVKHPHPPGRFDPGHCRDCAHEADLLDHYWQVQRQERAFGEAHGWAHRAHQHAGWALWCSSIGSCWPSSLSSPADPPWDADAQGSEAWKATTTARMWGSC